IVFHCIIFPIMLHSSEQYIVPQNVPANEFMNLEGDKMSTSRGWSIEMHEYIEDFPDKPDVLRYALLTNLPETKDSEFTWKDYQAKNNNELVAIFGNFVNRAMVLTNKYFEGKVPPRGNLGELETAVIKALTNFPAKIAASIENYRFREATANLMDLARLGNKYLADTEPWKLAKTDMDRVATILNLSLQIAANLSVLSSPFLPFSAKKLKKILNLDTFDWASAGSIDMLPTGHALGKAELLFDKIDDEVIERQVNRLIENRKKMDLQNQSAEPAKSEITFDDFSKLDMRIGKVIAAERVEKSKKLLKMQVDTGIDTRTVLSGIAEHYAPEEMIGKQVTILVNLAPRKIMGVESQGMILMAEDKDGSLKLISTNDPVSPGSMIS
ncbi:MAG: methionine--tRNA ligase subunit beta, partial [Cyclobacteriaceae bacterium]